MFIRTSDSSCTLDATDDGGYIKTNTIYKLHIAAMVGGVCQARAYQYPPGGCVNSITQYRTIGTSTLSVDGVTSGSVAVNPSNTQTIQSYDTRVPTNTLNTGSSYSTNTLGAHAFTSSTNATMTSCSFTPTSFPQVASITFNALKCEPKFSLYNNFPIRFAAGVVKIALDTATMSAASAALTAAVNDWNARLSSTGLRFSIDDCLSGLSCITVNSVTQSPYGYSNREWNADTGIITGNATITLGSDWMNYSSDGLQRTFAHELGHFIGLANYNSAACDVSDAVMQDQFNCSSQSVMKAVTINDYLPVANSVYGTKSRKSCGF